MQYTGGTVVIGIDDGSGGTSNTGGGKGDACRSGSVTEAAGDTSVDILDSDGYVVGERILPSVTASQPPVSRSIFANGAHGTSVCRGEP